MPRDKNEAKYLEFIGKGIMESFENMEEYEKLKNDTFYSNVKDIIYAVTIANSYLKGIYRINEIPIEPPYVTSMLVDFYYLGYCAKISFEHLRAFLVQKGEIKQEDIDASFVSIIFLKVSFQFFFLAFPYETIVRRSASSFGHSGPDPSSV